MRCRVPVRGGRGGRQELEVPSSLFPGCDGGWLAAAVRRAGRRRGLAAVGVPVHRAAQAIGGQAGSLGQVRDGVAVHPRLGAGSTQLSEPQLFGVPIAARLVDHQLPMLAAGGGDVAPSVAAPAGEGR